mgnify:CR=1 FL=1
MEELKTTTELVEIIMIADHDTRNNDNLLYLRLLSALGKQQGIDYMHMKLIEFFRQLPDMDVPTIETVSRLRQKVQQKYPNLKACEEVERFRAEREEKFRQFAKN